MRYNRSFPIARHFLSPKCWPLETKSETGYLNRSLPPKRSVKGQDWDCPPCMASSNNTMGLWMYTASGDGEPPFIFICPHLQELSTHRNHRPGISLPQGRRRFWWPKIMRHYENLPPWF